MKTKKEFIDFINSDNFLLLEFEEQRSYLILGTLAIDSEIKNPLGIIFKYGLDLDCIDSLIKLKLIYWDKKDNFITLLKTETECGKEMKVLSK